MAQTNQEYEAIENRMHKDLAERYNQLIINILGWKGGRPYVEERLSRFGGECAEDWEGGTRTDGSIVTGRKERAHVVPHLTRIVNKINEYVFSEAPNRIGLDEDIEKDISTDGKSLNQIMIEANSYLTVTNWCWIKIDSPLLTEDQISVAAKEENKIRPYFNIVSPLGVVDWYFDSIGKLQWVLTEEYEYIASSPFIKAQSVKTRTLWELGGLVTKYIYDDNGNHISHKETSQISLLTSVPFVLCGEISPEPELFDNLESINRTILDLESCNRELFYQSVFPQLHLPASILDTIMDKFSISAEDAVTRVIGMKYPILVGENDASPGYIMPDSGAIGSMRTELTDLQKELFNSVGLMIAKETRLVETAEAKTWNALDVLNLIKARSTKLEEVEVRAAKIANKWDSTFPVYIPQYTRDVEVKDSKAEMEVLLMANNVESPDELKKFILQRVFDLIQQANLDPKERKKIEKAIKKFGEEQIVKEVKAEVLEPEMSVTDNLNESER